MHHATDEPQSIKTNRPSSTRAELMLVLATLVWGASFAPAREAGEIVNNSLGYAKSATGPLLTLGVRFFLGAIIWYALVWIVRQMRFPGVRQIRQIDLSENQTDDSNRQTEFHNPEVSVTQISNPEISNPALSNPESSNLKSIPFSSVRATKYIIAVGLLLAIGLGVQHISLDFLPEDRAESMSAFLTSLTVITVPLTLWLIWRDRPSITLVLAIALAIAGLLLMTRRAEAHHADANAMMIWGIVLGILCAIVFAQHIIALNALAPRVSAIHLNGIQFAVVGVVSLLAALTMMMFTNRWPAWPMVDFKIWMLNVTILTLGPTLISHTLMVMYQPQVSPVRAAIIYMLEPVFATGFAWMWADKKLGTLAVIGAGLILLANVVAEIGPRIGRKNFSRS